MNQLIKSIEPLVSEELARANEKFPQFASAHEGYAIIKEEMEEARDELEDASSELDVVWAYTKANRIHEAKTHLLNIKKCATNLTAEAIQVAAMAQKFMDMMEMQENEQWGLKNAVQE